MGLSRSSTDQETLVDRIWNLISQISVITIKFNSILCITKHKYFSKLIQIYLESIAVLSLDSNLHRKHYCVIIRFKSI